MNSVLYCGIGGGGGNLVDLFAQNGYSTIAINFSQRDLDSLEYVDFKFKVRGSEGLGHNREEAIDFISKNPEEIVNFLIQHTANHNIIIFAFSTAGGSGSGLTPALAEIFSSVAEDKVIVTLPILPDLSESLIAQINTLKVFEELSSLNTCILPLDNEQIKRKHNTQGKFNLYNKANEEAMWLLDTLFSYTQKNSKTGNFDEKDLYMTLGTKGVASISHVDLIALQQIDELQLTKEGISHALNKSWKESAFSPISYDQIVRAGVIFDGKEDLLEHLDFHHIFSQFSSKPLDIFEGNYHEQDGTIMTILTGLSYNTHRLKLIEEIISNQKENAEKVMSTPKQYQSELLTGGFMTKIKSQSNPKTSQKSKSINDILSKYKRK